MPYEFKTRRIVEFADTDMAGIVHFATFFRYMEAAEHAFLRSLGLSVSMSIDGEKIGFPRVHAECDYCSPLRFEDEVELHVLVREIRTKALVFDLVFTRVKGPERRLVGRGSITAVCVRRKPDGSVESIALPAQLLQKIEAAPPEVLARTVPSLGPAGRRPAAAASRPHTEHAEIEAEQLAHLHRLLAELRTNPFYWPRIRAAGLEGGPGSIQEFCRKMPLTTRKELIEDQLSRPPYGSNLTYPLERYTRLHATSGTTATPLRWLDTPESWQWMLESWKVVFRAAGVEEGDRLFFGFSFGLFLGFWSAFEAASQMGLICLPGGGMSSAARLRTIFDNRATLLCCTPTYAVRLAEVAAEDGVDLTQSPIRRIVVGGEPGGSIPATRRLIESLWPGARVFDHHGMTEVGPVTYQCPARPGTLRVMESAYIAEVLDPQTLEPVREEGQMVELVLTPLGRLGSPLLRYRTGDLVRPIYLDAEGQGPGPYLSLDGGILGRSDDMVVVRGVNVFPSTVDQIVRSHPRVAEYRVEIDGSGSMTQMTVYVETTAQDSGAVDPTRSLQAAFRNHLSLRVPVRVVEPGSLPRFELKAKRWVRKGKADR